MNLKHVFGGVSTLCLLSACFAASSGEGGVEEPMGSEEASPKLDAAAADDETAPDATVPRDGTHNDPFVRATVVASLPMRNTAPPCQPLRFPVTLFVSGVFNEDHLVDETATPVPDARCRHEQVLEAPASVWAAFAYTALCFGGGDTLCGALTTRLCSADLLQRWGSQRSEPVKTRGPTFAFDYVVPPQDEPARAALQRRALQEVQTLLDETATVLRAHLAGTRDCPDEDADGILAIHTEGLAMYLQLSDGIAQP